MYDSNIFISIEPKQSKLISTANHTWSQENLALKNYPLKTEPAISKAKVIMVHSRKKKLQKNETNAIDLKVIISTKEAKRNFLIKQLYPSLQSYEILFLLIVWSVAVANAICEFLLKTEGKILDILSASSTLKRLHFQNCFF